MRFHLSPIAKIGAIFVVGIGLSAMPSPTAAVRGSPDPAQGSTAGLPWDAGDLRSGERAGSGDPRPAPTPAASSPVAEKGKVTVEKVEYKGWKNNLRLSNGEAELILTLDVGPRVISYKLTDGKNVFVELADQLGKSGETEWVARGGHRLWVGPEDLTRTYAPDNSAITSEELTGGAIRLIQNPDEYGIQKEMDVQLAPSGSKVTVTHRIKNLADKETELA